MFACLLRAGGHSSASPSAQRVPGTRRVVRTLPRVEKHARFVGARPLPTGPRAPIADREAVANATSPEKSAVRHKIRVRRARRRPSRRRLRERHLTSLRPLLPPHAPPRLKQAMHRAASAPAAQATRARSRYASRRLTRSLPPPRTRGTSFSRFSRLRAHPGEAFFPPRRHHDERRRRNTEPCPRGFFFSSRRDDARRDDDVASRDAFVALRRYDRARVEHV